MTLITLGVLARYLETTNYSEYLYFYAIAVIVSGLSDGGIRDSCYYLVSKSLSRKLFNHIYKVKILVTLAVFSTALLFKLLLPQSSLGVLLTVALLGCTLPVSDVGLMILKARNQPSVELALGIIEGVIAIVVFYNVGSQGLSFEFCLIVIALLGLARSLLSYLFSKSCIELDVENIAPIKYGFRSGSSIMPIFLGNFYNRIPALLLVDLIPAQSYNVLVTFLTLVQRMEVIPTALLQSQLANRNSINGLSGNIFNVLVALTGIGLVLLVILALLNEKLVLLLMGSGYIDFADTALIIIFVLPFVLVAYGARYFLQLELRVRSCSLWLFFCLVQSILTLYFYELTDYKAHALWINYFIYTIGFVLIAKNYLKLVSKK